VSGVDEQGQRIDVQDPLAEKLRQIHERCDGNIDLLIKHVLDVTEVFGERFKSEPKLIKGIHWWLRQFEERGVRDSIELRFSK
jgi:fructuronate reductase